MSFLRELVVQKIRSFPSLSEAADFFEVGEHLIRQWELGSKPVSLAAVEKVFDPHATPAEMAKEAKMWEGKSVAIMLPSYKTTNPRTAFSVWSMVDRAKMGVMLDFGDAFVAHSRNKLADNFLKSKIEWALTIDDDMIVPFGNAKLFNLFTRFNLPEHFAGLNTITRLLSHGKTLVGGLYFGRWAHGKAVYAEGQGSQTETDYAKRGPYDALKQTRWVGTGCMLIHRSVFLDIEKKFPQLSRNKDGDFGHFFTSSEHELRGAVGEALNILDDLGTSETARCAKARALMESAKSKMNHNSMLGVGEDVIFCTRALQSGHQPFVDMGLYCGHIGDYVFGKNTL